MGGANIRKKLWDWDQTRLKIVFIHGNVQFGTGPIFEEDGTGAIRCVIGPCKMGPDLQNCVHIRGDLNCMFKNNKITKAPFECHWFTFVITRNYRIIDVIYIHFIDNIY